MGTPGLLEDLQARGLVQDATDLDALGERLGAGPLTLYYGCDPTSDSLHIGNLIGLLVLRRFQRAGHHPIALAGGATGMIGDPSGKAAERVLLDVETLRANVESIKGQISRVLGPEGEWTLVDNHDWTKDLRLLEFLRDVGKHATVNQMVAKESVRARMQSEEGISFTEFSYMLLQAYDYLVLHEGHGCELQIGGSDQWGNITAGIDLVRRRAGKRLHGITWPLITRADGQKFGKSEGDNVWLAASRTSPYRFFQYWMQADDRDVGRYLRIFTLLDLDEVDELVARTAAAPRRREGHRALARHVTELVHGPDEAKAAEEATEVLFGGSEPSERALATLVDEIPTHRVAEASVAAGTPIEELLVSAGVAGSKNEARRLLQQGGIYVNGASAAVDAVLGRDDFRLGRYILIRRGKDKYHLVFVP
jgi:tyrosyl-tRNA synthetase